MDNFKTCFRKTPTVIIKQSSLKFSYGYFEAHPAIISTFVCVWKCPQFNKTQLQGKIRWSSQLTDSSFTTEMAFVCLPHKPPYLIAPSYCNLTLKKQNPQKTPARVSAELSWAWDTEIIVDWLKQVRVHFFLAQEVKRWADQTCASGPWSRQYRYPPIFLFTVLALLFILMLMQMHLWAPRMWSMQEGGTETMAFP